MGGATHYVAQKFALGFCTGLLHRAFGLGFRFGEPTEDAIVRCCVESHLGVARRVVLHLEWQGCRLAMFSYALFSLACFRLLISLE